MPICFADVNQEVVIQRITGSDKVKQHLEKLGLVVGETITIVNKANEDLIIKVKGVSMAISHDLAKRIFI